MKTCTGKKTGLVTPLTDEQRKRTGWSVLVDGNPIDASLVEICHDRFGSLLYGSRGAYDGWAFFENGGGGAVTLPYAIINNQLYIGVVLQMRDLQGGNVWNVPRGFTEGGSPLRDAIREEEEEFGFYDAASRMRKIPGQPVNPNSAFFDTSTLDAGVDFFAYRLNTNELELVEEESFGAEVVYQVRDGLADATDRVGEQILEARFIRWQAAAGLGDGFTRAGGFALMAALHDEERGFVPFSAVTLSNIDGLLADAAAAPRRRTMRFQSRDRETNNRSRILYFQNAIYPDSYVAPHKHDKMRQEDEHFTLLRGHCLVLFFSDSGEINEIVDLSEVGMGVQVHAGRWHSVLALEPTVLNEAKPGPYIHAWAKDFAPWAPDEDDGSAPRRQTGIDFLNECLTAFVSA